MDQMGIGLNDHRSDSENDLIAKGLCDGIEPLP